MKQKYFFSFPLLSYTYGSESSPGTLDSGKNSQDRRKNSFDFFPVLLYPLFFWRIFLPEKSKDRTDAIPFSFPSILYFKKENFSRDARILERIPFVLQDREESLFSFVPSTVYYQKENFSRDARIL